MTKHFHEVDTDATCERCCEEIGVVEVSDDTDYYAADGEVLGERCAAEEGWSCN